MTTIFTQEEVCRKDGGAINLDTMPPQSVQATFPESAPNHRRSTIFIQTSRCGEANLHHVIERMDEALDRAKRESDKLTRYEKQRFRKRVLLFYVSLIVEMHVSRKPSAAS